MGFGDQGLGFTDKSFGFRGLRPQIWGVKRELPSATVHMFYATENVGL